ncbi:hypothetical protein [Nonomuraea indica]|uniref:hypothetical protein n=1 Tax=Nonomuraea indica TaxID=1581193 RepID=UPI001183B27C|nr:hypothetical protein [Nonomuraea indica]
MWIEWRHTLIQTQALLALAGAPKDFEADPHADFDDLYGPPRPAPKQDPEERRRIIAALAAG